MTGEVCHFELTAANVPRARKFYEKAFGWKMTGLPDMGYTLVQTAEVGKSGLPKERGVINGGMMKRSGPFRHPIITIWVKDIDAAQKKIKKAGGRSLGEKNQVGDMGWAAYFKDTEGNIVGLFQPAV